MLHSSPLCHNLPLPLHNPSVTQPHPLFGHLRCSLEIIMILYTAVVGGGREGCCGWKQTPWLQKVRHCYLCDEWSTTVKVWPRMLSARAIFQLHLRETTTIPIATTDITTEWGRQKKKKGCIMQLYCYRNLVYNKWPCLHWDLFVFQDVTQDNETPPSTVSWARRTVRLTWLFNPNTLWLPGIIPFPCKL